MPVAATHYTRKEEEIVAHHAKRGMLRYKDESAYYCVACTGVINVICPRCKAGPETQHGEPPLFARVSYAFHIYDGYRWVEVECHKCDFRFKVIAR